MHLEKRKGKSILEDFLLKWCISDSFSAPCPVRGNLRCLDVQGDRRDYLPVLNWVRTGSLSTDGPKRPPAPSLVTHRSFDLRVYLEEHLRIRKR